jgi:hypothetical protein
MGITLLTFSGLLAPLQHLANWLASGPARQPQRHGRMTPVAVPVCGTGNRGRSTWRPAARTALPSRGPVRVVRVVDRCQAPASAGRMVISGRMADVCAELDRLAAIEARRAH